MSLEKSMGEASLVEDDDNKQRLSVKRDIENTHMKKMTTEKKKILDRIIGNYSYPFSLNDVREYGKYGKIEGKGNIEIENGKD